MLHILSLLVLPFLVSSAEAKGAILYLCFGDGCSGWDIALTCLSIIFTMCCLVSAFASCCRARAKEEEQFQTETVWSEENMSLLCVEKCRRFELSNIAKKENIPQLIFLLLFLCLVCLTEEKGRGDGKSDRKTGNLSDGDTRSQGYTWQWGEEAREWGGVHLLWRRLLWAGHHYDLSYPCTPYLHNLPLPPWLCQMLWWKQWWRGLLWDGLIQAGEDFQEFTPRRR